MNVNTEAAVLVRITGDKKKDLGGQRLNDAVTS